MLLGLPWLGAGCHEEQLCTTEAEPSVVVTVVDAKLAPVTDAAVSYRVDGGAEEPCDDYSSSGNVYDCGWEQPGSFVITAERGGVKRTSAVEVEKGECHVVTAKVTVTFP